MLKEDLEHILGHTASLWETLRGQDIFVTGGTGFFGCWLLESFRWADRELGLGARATVLTRNPEAFRRKMPSLASAPCIRFLEGDVLSAPLPDVPFRLIIHAATDASLALNAERPLLMLDTIVEGTRRVLELARRTGAGEVLLASSGAVYGRQPHDLRHVPETFAGGPDPTDPASAYAEGKRTAELLCALYARQHGVQAKIARCFAFVGPYLPQDGHFAIGNFIRDALRSGPILVRGDGTPHRSYLYAADLVIWLLTVLFKGQAGRPYNIGSEHDLTIAELAQRIASRSGAPVEVDVLGKAVPGAPAERYVPSTRRAAVELGLEQHIGLDEAIDRTMRWSRAPA